MKASATALLLLILLPLSFINAQAQCVTHATECLMPVDCFPWQWNGFVSYGAGRNMGQLNLYNPSSCTAFPPVGDTSDVDFNTDANAFWETTGYDVGSAHLIVHEMTVADDGTNKTVNLEMLLMDISGGTFPSGWKIRESPTLASTGQASTEPSQVGNGRAVNVEFDLSTELTTNGGQTWVPASVPLHLMFYQSTPAQDLTWGRLKATYR
ncbi:MAG TPA: hypothetical protein VGR66_07285 [Candidatus Eisenbacteria bacterium]|nr:hypothetical protein [Candidatus Eisenbacteria bacterium]